MPRWTDEKKEIPELYEQRKAREMKLFEDNNPLKCTPFNKVCDAMHKKSVLTHFYTDNYGLLEVEEADVRNLFLTWCMGERNMSFDEIREMDVNTASKIFKEFESDLEKHPILHKDPEPNAAWYGKIFGKAFSRLNDLTYPAQADLATPEGLFSVRKSNLYLMGYLSSMYCGYMPGSLKSNKEFNNEFDKHMPQKGLENVCNTLTNYVYLVGTASNPENDSAKRFMNKVMLESDIGPLFAGKKVTESFKVGRSNSNNYFNRIVNGIEKINYDEVGKDFVHYDVELLMDEPFSKIKETEPFIADKVIEVVNKNVKSSVTFSGMNNLVKFDKTEAELEWEERVDDFERKCDNADELIRRKEKDEHNKHFQLNGTKAKAYREEIFSLGESLRNGENKVKDLRIAKEGYKDLDLKAFINTLTENKAVLKETAEAFDDVFSKLTESQSPLFNDRLHKNIAGRFTGYFRVYSKDGTGRDATTRIRDAEEAVYLGLTNEEMMWLEKSVILYYMTREDYRVDYHPLVYRSNGTIYKSQKSFPVSNPDLVYIKQPTDDEIAKREEQSVKAAEEASLNNDRDAEQYLDRNENLRKERAEKRKVKRAELQKILLIKSGNTEVTEEDFYKRAYENGWKKEEDEAFLKAVAQAHLKERRETYGSSRRLSGTISMILNNKLPEKTHYREREKVINEALSEYSDHNFQLLAKDADSSAKNKLYLEEIESHRDVYALGLKEQNPYIRDFLIASFGACFNKDGSVDEELKKMRDEMYSKNIGLNKRLDDYVKRIMSIPAENRSAEQEKAYKAALIYNEEEKKNRWISNFPDRMKTNGWFFGGEAKRAFGLVRDGKKYISKEDEDAFAGLMDAFEKGEHIDHPGIKVSGSPDGAKLTIDMLKKARDLINAGPDKREKRWLVKDLDSHIADVKFQSLSAPVEKTVRALKEQDMIEMGRVADRALENIGENASEEYRAALNAVKSFSEEAQYLENYVKYNYSYYDNRSPHKDHFFEKFYDLDAKLSVYLNMVNGEDPDMLSVWAKINPEKAAVYADKMPAPKKEEVHANEEENVIHVNENAGNVNENADNDHNEIIIENNVHDDHVNENENAGNINENAGNVNENENAGNVNENAHENEQVQIPDGRIAEVGIMNAQKEKFMVIKANLGRVVHAYLGHTNSEEYNRMIRKLGELTEANDPDRFAELRGELGEQARKYLDHTGLGKASHPNSEIRRKCAFLIMAYADHPLYAHYAERANNKRSEEHKISFNTIDNMPGVGAPAPLERNRVNINELANEQQIAEGGAQRERRGRRANAANAGRENNNRISIRENGSEPGERKSSGPARKSGN